MDLAFIFLKFPLDCPCAHIAGARAPVSFDYLVGFSGNISEVLDHVGDACGTAIVDADGARFRVKVGVQVVLVCGCLNGNGIVGE